MTMKRILLTGASSGIGAATARELAAAGHHVMLAARRTDRLQALSDELGDHASFVATDVTDGASVRHAVHTTIEVFGGLDVLINNAGLGHMGPLEETPLSDWHHMVDVNVKGVLNCVHAALPQLTENEGTIINLSSVAAHGVFPTAVVYCATKHAVAAISKGLRLELRGRVKVTDISPGAVETEFLDHTTHEATHRNYKENAFGGVVLTADDIARTIRHVLDQPDHVVISEVIVRPNT